MTPCGRKKLTPNLFQQWFDVEIHSVLTDLVEEPLEREQFAELDLSQDEDHWRGRRHKTGA